MKLSEYISRCSSLLEEKGDMEVLSSPPEIIQAYCTWGYACLSDLGSILLHTMRPSQEESEEYCQEFFPAWEKMKELGCRVVRVDVSTPVDRI